MDSKPENPFAYELVTLHAIDQLLAKLELSATNIDKLSKSHLKSLGLSGVEGYSPMLIPQEEYDVYFGTQIHPRELVNVINDKHNTKVNALLNRKGN